MKKIKKLNLFELLSGYDIYFDILWQIHVCTSAAELMSNPSFPPFPSPVGI